MADDLRKLKDEAAKAVERGKYRRAAELYDALATREADPLWPHRAGEAYRRAGLVAEAVERLGVAAEGYEGQGFISKAIAVCKMILEVDPQHAVAQERLGRLGPRRNTPLMMPAVNADGVPIRSASELVPAGGAALALDKTPAAGGPRVGHEPATLDTAPRTKTIPVAFETVPSGTKAVPPVSLEPTASPRTKAMPPVSLEASPPRTRTTPPLPLEAAPASPTKTAPPVSPEPVSPSRTKTIPPLPLESGLGLEPSAPPRTKTDPPRLPDPPRTKTPPPIVPEAQAPPRTKTAPPIPLEPASVPRTKTAPPIPLEMGSSPPAKTLSSVPPEASAPPRTKTAPPMALEPAAPLRTKTAPPLAPEPALPPRTKTVPPIAVDPVPGPPSLATPAPPVASSTPAASSAPTLPPASSAPARPRSRTLPPILPEATASVPRPRSLAPPPPASLHPPSTTRTPVMVPAVPRPGEGGSSSPGGGGLALITPGAPESLPLSPSAPAGGRQRRTTSEFPAVEMPLDDEGLRPMSEGPAGVPRIPLFWLLGEERLRSVLERCGRLEVPAGEVILRQGDQADNLYVVLRGAVDVSVRSPRGEEPLGRRGAGEFFGELPLLVQQRQPATVTAVASTALLRLDRALMEEILAEALPMRQMLLRTARDRAIERLVATSPLFDTLGVADAAALVGRFEFRDLAPGSLLITQGEAVSTLLVVLAGGCDVVFRQGGVERPVALLGPGDLVGAVSLLERKPADVSVRTRTRVWALAMSPATFREVIVTYPTVLIHVGEVAQQRHARLAQLRG